MNIENIFVISVNPSILRNHPVVGVTWYEAMAYCRWLTNEMRNGKDLPDLLSGRLKKEQWDRLPSHGGGVGEGGQRR